jgi:hypothetical protein
MEKIFNSVTLVSKQLKIYDEFKQSILQMKIEGKSDNDQAKEIIEKIEGSSVSLHNAFLEINTQLSNLKVTQPNDPQVITIFQV